MNSIDTKLNHFCRENRIPHIIFHGESGSGKKTIVNNFIKKIYNFHESNIKDNVMIVNCAHGKGIKFIREELKFFAKTNVHFKSGIFFKIIVLINADYLTVDAQSALRRCIEQFSRNTRFFIVIENKNKLLTPIVSRFCEIHVPINTIDNKPTNVHKLKIQQHYIFHDHFENKALEYIDSLIQHDIRPSYPNLLQIVNNLFNEGIHCFNFIRWLKERSKCDELKVSTIEMYFQKIRLEYRCEKWILLCLLDSYYSDNDLDLKSLSFM